MGTLSAVARGIRNNNPGNIIKSAIKWKGKVMPDKNTDGRFEQFTDMKYGVRAIMVDLRNKISNEATDTIAEIIRKWAPSNENDTNGYIAFVAKETCIGQDVKLQAGKGTLTLLAKAIIKQETGAKLDDQVYEDAFNLI
jgi:hypothetical protein